MLESTNLFSHLIVLRFANEALEILPRGADSIRLSSWTEADTQVYAIELPPGCNVRPIDWRHVAYDHAEVRQRLAQCVQDNLADTVVEVGSAEVVQEVAARIRLALVDLSSVFDVIDVTCELHAERMHVVIEGEFKNGVRGTIVCTSAREA